MANDDDQDGGAAQAFAELRAEVTGMRRAMESLPAVIKSLAPPDYAPSFGAVGKTLASVDARLAGIEGHPALNMTPAQHGGAMQQAGADILREAVNAMNAGAQELWGATREVASIAVTARDAEAQKRAALGGWRRRRRRVGFVSDARRLRAGRELSGGMGDGEHRPLAGRGFADPGGKPGAGGSVGRGAAARQREC